MILNSQGKLITIVFKSEKATNIAIAIVKRAIDRAITIKKKRKRETKKRTKEKI